MKKIFMSLPIFAALLMTGCTSDDIEENVKPTPVKDVITLTAELSLEDEGSRITFDEDNGRQLYWDVNDEITIVGKNGGKVLYVASNVMEDNKRLASFIPKDDAESLTEDDFPAEAFYPASLASKVLPAEQKYDGTKLSDVNPMYAVFETAGAKAMFSNLCGLLAIKLKGKNGGEVVNEIRISADEAMSGAFDVAESNGKYKAVLTQEAKQAKAGITLKCGEDGVTLSKDESTKFFVAIPEGVYHNLSIITIGNELDGGGIENDAKVMKVGASLDIKRNKFTTINEYAIDYLDFDSQYLLPGLFTVDAEGHKVQFTRGNLYWDINKCSFGIEQNQYDLAVDVSTSVLSPTRRGYFYWSTSVVGALSGKTDSLGLETKDYNVLFTNRDNNGQMVDPTFNVYGKQDLYTLFGDKPSYAAATNPYPNQMDYILNKRVMTYGKPRFQSTNTGITIDGVNYIGVFLFPDDYNNEQVGAWNGPKTWAEINALGIVFLRDAGYVKSNTTGGIVDGTTKTEGLANYQYTHYWNALCRKSGSSTYRTYVGLNGWSTIGFGNRSDNYAYPIRLVKDVKGLTVTANDIYNDEIPGWWK